MYLGLLLLGFSAPPVLFLLHNGIQFYSKAGNIDAKGGLVLKKNAKIMIKTKEYQKKESR